jgi:hypothetical protein
MARRYWLLRRQGEKVLRETAVREDRFLLVGGLEGSGKSD